jgi:hypothetical protein
LFESVVYEREGTGIQPSIWLAVKRSTTMFLDFEVKLGHASGEGVVWISPSTTSSGAEVEENNKELGRIG